MTEEEINNKRNEEFLELLERTKQIKSRWEVYSSLSENKITDYAISKRMYVEHFLMSSTLDAFMHRESLNLKELFEIIFNEKIPRYFFFNIPLNHFNFIIIKMIKLGYIEPFKEEKTIVPIFQVTDLGIKTLQQRTLENLALSSFYSYQSYKLNKRAINISLIAIVISAIAAIISIMLK